MLNYFGEKPEKGCFKGYFMKRVPVSFIMVMFLCSASFWSCSKNKDTESKKGAIEKMTEKAGKKIADKLQKPIRQARSVKEKQEERDKELEKALKGQ
jgi:DNA topoisomerase VI subunit B